MSEKKNHGHVMLKFNELNRKLTPYGLFVKAWGSLAIAEIENPHSGYIANNLDSIEEVAQWVEGFIYCKSLNKDSE